MNLLSNNGAVVKKPMPQRQHGLSRLATRIFDTPLLIHPQKLETILAVLGPRIGLGSQRALDMNEKVEARSEPESIPMISVIPVYGTLVKRSTGMDAMSGMTSYDELAGMVNAAMMDDACKALVFDIDSPGGEAAGLFDFCDYLTSLRGTKPMIGVSNDAAYSAAYCIGSCMDKLLVTEVGGVGSIGCYMLHMDQSQYDREQGVKYTYIHAGAKKVEGNPHEPLSNDAETKLQAQVDRIRDMFVTQVARNRGVSSDDLMNTEAGVYMGGDGVPLLADGVGSFGNAVELAMGMIGAANKPPAAAPGGKRRDTAAAMSSLRASKMLMNMAVNDLKLDGNLVVMRQLGTLKLTSGFATTESITGILAPYDKMSCDLGGFREVYTPGCFTRFLKSNDDALVLGFHRPENVLGRRSNGTANFWDEADGLHFSAEMPDTQFARDLKTLIERGDVRGSSAAFYITKHRWETRSGERVRIIEEAELVEGSPHSLVAYEHSTAVVVEKDKIAAYDIELARARLSLLK